MVDYDVIYKVGGIHHCAPEWDWHFGPMHDYDLWVVLEGQGTMEVGGERIPLERGSAFLLSPGSSGYASHDPKHRLTVAAVHFDFTADLYKPETSYKKLDEIDFIGKLIRQAILAAGNDLIGQASLWLKAALLKTGFAEIRASQNRYAENIEKICRNVINHPGKKYDIGKMAAGMYMCRDHFTRVFKKHKGISPNEFVVRARINRACALLSVSNLSISEVAEETGYCSVNFFCRQFKKQTGKTPLQYRRKAS